MCERCDELEEGLRRILEWTKAYPPNIFHEPSADEAHRAHVLLRANGMTLDAFSASALRHGLEGIGEIAKGALDA